MYSQNDLVSVIIATHQRTDLLLRALRSVCGQTHRALDIIVVDDNAGLPVRSDVAAIIASLADSRIRLIQNDQRLGGALSRNVGIAAAKGDLVAFLDDDDLYLPDKLEKQYRLFQQRQDPRLALVYCYTAAYDQHGILLREYRHDHTGCCVYEAMRDCIAATSQWMCSRHWLNRVGGFDDVPCKQDSMVMVKLLTQGAVIDRVPELLSHYHQHAGPRISGGDPAVRIAGETALWALCRAHDDLLLPRQRTLVDHSFACRLLPCYVQQRDRKNALRMLTLLLKRPLSVETLRVVRQSYLLIRG